MRHGRFAMTAFLAIFFEEADRSAGLHQLGRVKIKDKLNGTLGLDEVQAPALLAGLAPQRVTKDGDVSAVEYKKDRSQATSASTPLGLSKGSGADVKGLHNIEMKLAAGQ